jgi:hypothetical protein
MILFGTRNKKALCTTTTPALFLNTTKRSVPGPEGPHESKMGFLDTNQTMELKPKPGSSYTTDTVLPKLETR